ncbi:MAG TPA: hypothetical protein VEC35_23450 [Noviherbaspirillum sp.]|nr:hypothetical protein [Noviherbaspirillum sp.]
MRYPNLRYGNPNELIYYGQRMPLKDLAKHLRRDERTVRDWMNGRKKVPWWVPEILRLQAMEHADRLRQMQIYGHRQRLGLVVNNVIAFPSPNAALDLKDHHTPLHADNPSENTDSASAYA